MIYDDADATFDTLALVMKDGCQQYINRDGEAVYTWTGEETAVGEFCNGMFWVETEEIRISGNVSTMTYYNENGEMAFSIEGAKNATINYGQETLSDYNEFGYAVVCIQGADRDENRVIDKSGKIQEWVQINEYRSFEEMIGPSYCILRWKSAGEACYINYEEKTVAVYDIDERYDVHALYNIWNLTYLGNGYYINHDAVYVKDRYQYLVKDDELILRLDAIEEFGGASVQKVLLTEHEKQDYFWVVLKNADGNIFVSLIDESGKVIISPTNKIATYFYKPGSWVSQEYYISYSFSAGLCMATATKTGKFGFIDISGEWVIEPQYDEVTDFYGEGDDAVAVVDENTIINRKGEVVYTIVTGE